MRANQSKYIFLALLLPPLPRVYLMRPFRLRVWFTLHFAVSHVDLMRLSVYTFGHWLTLRPIRRTGAV